LFQFRQNYILLSKEGRKLVIKIKRLDKYIKTFCSLEDEKDEKQIQLPEMMKIRLCKIVAGSKVCGRLLGRGKGFCLKF